MISNRIISQWPEHPGFAGDLLSLFWSRCMNGTPVHDARWRIARFATLPFPPNCENVFAPTKQISKERDLFFWRGNLACACGRKLWDENRLGNGFVGGRTINPEHRTETSILFTKPLAFFLRCF